MSNHSSRPSEGQHAPHSASSSRSRLPYWCVLVALLAALGFCFGFGGFQSDAPTTTEPEASSILPPEPEPEPEPQPVVQTVDFSATGDNLIHAKIYQQAAERAVGDAQYSFDYCYQNLVSFYSGYDVNWINQETLCTDELEPSTYPCFSTPGDCARALYRAGIRVFSLSTTTPMTKAPAALPQPSGFGHPCRMMW